MRKQCGFIAVCSLKLTSSLRYRKLRSRVSAIHGSAGTDLVAYQTTRAWSDDPFSIHALCKLVANASPIVRAYGTVDHSG